MPLKRHIYTHMCKLLDVHQWGKYTNIYATYELIAINSVDRTDLQRRCQ